MTITQEDLFKKHKEIIKELEKVNIDKFKIIYLIGQYGYMQNKAGLQF